jgi:competence protein ComEC
MMPSMPNWAFAAIIAGLLWLCLWTTRIRIFGLVPMALGSAGAWTAPTPDLLITGDGRHLVVVSENGTPLLLRERAGDYVRQLLAEASGFDGDPQDLGTTDGSSCSRDSCTAAIGKDGKEWRLLALRSATRIEWAELTRACALADVVVSDRRLPRGCVPRWLKLDAPALRKTGGVAIYFGPSPRVDSVVSRVGLHPWAQSTEPLRRAPHRQLAPAGVDEVKPAAARERKDRLGDRAAGLDH